MSGRKCDNCGSTDIEEDVTGANVVCTGCGTVLESGIVVCDAGGGLSTGGTFVSSERKGGGGTNFGRSFNSGIGQESRDVTLKNARKKIHALAQQLRLFPKHVDIAFHFYELSLAKHLTRGRKSSLVIGACVYITCRTQQTNHLLIDFSDVLQVGVYELGRTYLKLSQALCINIPAMDPCLYVMRFANQLQIGDKTQQVSTTALRLVSRMKRDWIHLGRTPSGLCGAALHISSRLHQCPSTVIDVVKIVKLHESTVTKRLREFGETSVSDLTIEEFMTADLEAMEDEQDPPSFTRARKKDKERLNLMELDTKINNDVSHLEEVIEEYLNVEPKVVEKLEESKEVSSGSQEGMDSLLMSPPEIASRHVSAQPCSPGLGVKDTVEEYLAPTHRRTDKECLEEATDELDLNGINDEEIDTYILTEREVEWKTAMWHKVNKEYVEEQEMKAKREEEKREEILRKRINSNQKKNMCKKRCKLRKNETAPDVIEKLELGKKISTKINYDALKILDFSPGDSSVTATEKKNETTESSRMKLEKETMKEGKQTIFSSQRIEKLSKVGTRSKRQRLSQKPNLVSRKCSLIKDVKQGVQLKCQDVLGGREPVVEDGTLLHSEAGCPMMEEAPIVPYEEEELPYLEDDDAEPVSAAELLARWEGFGGEEHVEEEKYL